MVKKIALGFSGQIVLLLTWAASRPETGVAAKLDFLEPFEGHIASQYKLRTYGAITTVARATVSPTPYVSRLMGIFMNLDSMIAKGFEQGLANLKAIAEKP